MTSNASGSTATGRYIGMNYEKFKKRYRMYAEGHKFALLKILKEDHPDFAHDYEKEIRVRGKGFG